MKLILTSLVISVIGIGLLGACAGNVYSLKVGNCYNGPNLNTESTVNVTDVEIVNCDEPHESEVYANFELPDSIWPGYDYIENQAEMGCIARFEAFAGVEYDLSTLLVDYIYPTEESWKDDRFVKCSVVEESYIKVSGSLRGSRR
jgi:hypothetical protein